MSEVRDKKKAYVEKTSPGCDGYLVRNWKNEEMGQIVFKDDWSIFVFMPNSSRYFGPEFLKSLAFQMEEIQEKEEAGWE